MSFLDYSAIFPYGFSTSSATGASFASEGSGASSPSSPVAGAPPPSAMVGPALSGASQLDSVDLSDGEDAVAAPKWRSIPFDEDSDGLSDRVGSPSGSPSKVGPGLGPSPRGSPVSPTPSELSRFSSASGIQRREAASQSLTDGLGARARTILVQGAPSAAFREIAAMHPAGTLRPLGEEALEALRVIVATLPLAPPRELDLRSAAAAVGVPPIVVWTDAMWSPEARVRGCLGFVIFIPPGRDRDFPRGRFLYSYLDVGEDVIARFEPRATHIGQLELLAAIMVYTTVPSLVAGQFVLHFIDNTSALAGLISGSSRS